MPGINRTRALIGEHQRQKTRRMADGERRKGVFVSLNLRLSAFICGGTHSQKAERVL
jgi:hypothetical protein